MINEKVASAVRMAPVELQKQVAQLASNQKLTKEETYVLVEGVKEIAANTENGSAALESMQVQAAFEQKAFDAKVDALQRRLCTFYPDVLIEEEFARCGKTQHYKPVYNVLPISKWYLKTTLTKFYAWVLGWCSSIRG